VKFSDIIYIFFYTHSSYFINCQRSKLGYRKKIHTTLQSGAQAGGNFVFCLPEKFKTLHRNFDICRNFQRINMKFSILIIFYKMLFEFFFLLLVYYLLTRFILRHAI